ncbi:hypothetical protein LTR56_010374 [Elasticomyces elasticus]|nr:hypothetical protein LTR56_010374 [Elasticomyces elasticus]KAK3656941.1 hypothetical protein LTR22_009604 [Elasticomyces elasticus]KAK4926056.1 hypothetical protein LTR49_006970 [Elasticomyces elasticus]KAK5766173.1 hypothetical protein LTS12_003657 [Elasticomyces elasticus]
MGRSDDSMSSGAELPQAGIKAFPEAVVASSGWFSKTEGRTTFETSSLDSHYKPIDSYEGRHRYDPDFEWTPAEEKRVVRKIDYKICSWVCLMFFALQLDRGNISQALSDNMLDETLASQPTNIIPAKRFFTCVSSSPNCRPNSFQSHRARQLDPDPNGHLVLGSEHASFSLRSQLVLGMSSAAGDV